MDLQWRKAGYNFKTLNTEWYDALRVTKLPSFKKEFAPDGKVFYSVRQSHPGAKSSVSTVLGEFLNQLFNKIFFVIIE